MREQDRMPTVESVGDGLAKLIREVRTLQSEVRNLTGAVYGFHSKNPRPYAWRVLPPGADGGNPEARYQTDEPQSKIELVRYQYCGNPNLEIPTRTLLAIAHELDGALRDVRAARTDIKAIAEDSDLREDFKEWQRNQARPTGKADDA